MNDLILYTTEGGKNRIKLRAKDQTVWLSQREMAQLFDVSTDNVGLHLKSIFEDAELSREATTEESSVVQTEGGRQIQQAKSKRETRMSFWKGNVDQIITSNGFPLLAHAGSVSHEQMESDTNALYLDYDQRRKAQEAQSADQEDEADLKTLENKIKRRSKK